MSEIVVGPEEAEDPLLLAIDAGTSSIRALIYDRRGRMVQGWNAQRAYHLDTTPDGGATIDAGMLAGLTAEAIDAVLGQTGKCGRRPAAVALDTFWHGLLGLDSAGDPLTPIFTWADTRSAGAARVLRDRLDERAVHARTGAGLHASYFPAKLLWLAQAEPELFFRVRFWLSFGEYLYLHWFGERRVSYSMASGTGLLDESQLCWDRALLDALPITADQLCPLSDYFPAMQGLRPQWAARWPALASLPWFLALGDGACNNVGSAGVSPDWTVLMIGTSGAMRVVREAVGAAIPTDLWTYRVDGRRIVQGGALSAGGNIHAWLEEVLKLPADAELEATIAAAAPDSHGLTVVPSLAGERSPDWNPHARGTITGLSLDSTPEEIVQASYEGVAYRFGEVWSQMRRVLPAVNGIIGSGAALFRSPAWAQILADVLETEVELSPVPEATSRGAVLLALEALGEIGDLAALIPPLGARVEARPEYRERYRRARARQHALSCAIQTWQAAWEPADRM